MEFKTDNKELFEFSLEEVEEAGWNLEASTLSLIHILIPVLLMFWSSVKLEFFVCCLKISCKRVIDQDRCV